ncbi:MAG: class I SAM-dependent methyltransferase, partial [Candidatus Limnocylindrales bacterium]
ALEHQAVDLGLGAPPELVVGCILANEFLDALPVHRVMWRDGRLQERYVTWRDGWFGDDFDEPSTPDLAAHLLADGVSLADGQAADICLAATDWMRAAAGALDRGSVVVIDYGHEAAESYGPRRMAGTLLGYRSHQVQEDPYAGVGRTDLTAHVDLTAIARAAADAGLTARAPTTLGAFVVELGLGDLLSALGRDPATPPEDYLLARSVVARMLDPRHLGAQRVAIFERHR